MSTSGLDSGTTSGADPYRPFACCHSHCEFIRSSFLLCLGGLISLVSSISPALSLPVSSSSGLPEPLGEGFDEEIPFRSECVKVSHALHVWLWVSVLVLNYCRCEFSDDD